jgi:tripartite-type tricarboxylate transporter receptor subunit TctC
MRNFKLHSYLFIAALLLGLQGQGYAQEYPTKTVRIIVPTSAGSTTDALARMISEKLTVKWGQTVYIENRAGAAGAIGGQEASRSAPDGYTLLIMAGPVLQKVLNPKLNFEPDKLVPLSIVGTGFNVLVVNPKTPAETLPELIAYAKANPGKLNYASTGAGYPAHLTAEMLKSMTNTKMLQVPYKGNAPAINDLVAGQVDMMFINLAQAWPSVRGGKLRLLAISGDKRSPLLPDVPTVGETVPGFSSLVWFGMYAPPGTPAPLAKKISGALHEALHTPEIAGWLSANTFNPVGGTSAESAKFIREDTDRWVKIIKELGITVE